MCVCVFGQRDFGFFRFGDPAISKSPDKEEERNSDGVCSGGGIANRNIRRAGGLGGFLCVYLYIYNIYTSI